MMENEQILLELQEARRTIDKLSTDNLALEQLIRLKDSEINELHNRFVIVSRELEKERQKTLNPKGHKLSGDPIFTDTQESDYSTQKSPRLSGDPIFTDMPKTR